MWKMDFLVPSCRTNLFWVYRFQFQFLGTNFCCNHLHFLKIFCQNIFVIFLEPIFPLLLLHLNLGLLLSLAKTWNLILSSRLELFNNFWRLKNALSPWDTYTYHDLLVYKVTCYFVDKKLHVCRFFEGFKTSRLS